jgi:hypothetical protein
MRVSDVLDTCRREWVMVTRDGDRVRLEPLDPDRPVPKVIIEAVRRHKPEILGRLRYEERVDSFIIESTRRIGDAWPDGCPLDTPTWWETERAIHDSHVTQDVERLQQLLDRREALAMRIFERYGNEVPHA